MIPMSPADNTSLAFAAKCGCDEDPRIDEFLEKEQADRNEDAANPVKTEPDLTNPSDPVS